MLFVGALALAQRAKAEDTRIGRALVGHWSGACPNHKDWTFGKDGTVIVESQNGQRLMGTFHEDGSYSGEGHGGGFPNYSNTAAVSLIDRDHIVVNYTWQIPPFQGPAHPESCTASRAPEAERHNAPSVRTSALRIVHERGRL